MREGHAAVLEATMDARLPPWKVIPRGRTMRPAEPCTVTALQYVIAEDATAATVARVTLQLSDPASPLSGQRFTVDIPSPASGQAEFVILRSRFDAAVAHKWAVGDECLVSRKSTIVSINLRRRLCCILFTWENLSAFLFCHPFLSVEQGYWQTGTSEEGIVGEWWRGRVTEDRRGSSAVGTDPFTCGGLWECYTVQWEGPVSAAAHPESSQGRNDENGAGPSTAAAGQPPSPTAAAPEEGDGGEGGAFPQNGTANGVSGEKSCDLHSPWELHPLSAETADPLPPGTPHLDVEVARRAAAAIAAAAAIDRWAIFQAAPEWDEAYRSLTTRAEFYNRRIPLPLGLMDVTSRLELGYYRHASALEHDIRTIADNAAVFNGPSSDIAADAKCMAQYLLAVVGGEEGADPQVYAAMADEAQEVGEEEHGDPEGSDEDAGGGVQPRSRARRQPLTWWNGEQDGSEEQERAPRSRRPSRRAAAAAAEGEGVGRSGRYSLRDHSQRVRYSDVVGVDESDEEERGQRRRVREPSPPPVHGYSTRRAEHHHAEHAVAAVAEVTQGPRSGVGQNEEGSAPRTRIRLSLRR